MDALPASPVLSLIRVWRISPSRRTPKKGGASCREATLSCHARRWEFATQYRELEIRSAQLGVPKSAVGSGSSAGESRDDHDVMAALVAPSADGFLTNRTRSQIIRHTGRRCVLKELITGMRQAVELLEIPHYLLRENP